MNRTEYMRAVYATDLDPPSKCILVYLGFCKNWKDGTMAFPSAAKVAADTGFSIATVKRKMPELRAKGYLSDTGQRRGRGVIVYDLTDPTSITVMPQEYHSDTKQHQSDTAEVSERDTEQVSEQVQELVREQETPTTVPDGPVDEDTSNIKEDEPMNYLLLLNRGARHELETYGRTYGATSEQVQEAAYLLTRNRVRGFSFGEKCSNALIKVGLEPREDDWAV